MARSVKARGAAPRRRPAGPCFARGRYYGFHHGFGIDTRVRFYFAAEKYLRGSIMETPPIPSIVPPTPPTPATNPQDSTLAPLTQLTPVRRPRGRPRTRPIVVPPPPREFTPRMPPPQASSRSYCERRMPPIELHRNDHCCTWCGTKNLSTREMLIVPCNGSLRATGICIMCNRVRGRERVARHHAKRTAQAFVAAVRLVELATPPTDK
jgi:hypothetical protein